ncbi:MAG: hypothetical protein GXX96_31565 [Planctomycetaceae bacterium]|nr:hypothetical protein [Planctomycetaceae bacterium]
MTSSNRKTTSRSRFQGTGAERRRAADRPYDFLRQVIPIASHQQPVAEGERDHRGILAGVTLIVLHLASAALALACF